MSQENLLPVLYRGSVKNVLGPIKLDTKAVLFQYTDAYSVFDWGKMPDSLNCKGASLAIMAAYMFERLQKPDVWKAFSQTSIARDLRKGIASIPAVNINQSEQLDSLAANFNEIGEMLQKNGLSTHYLGCVPENIDVSRDRHVSKLNSMDEPFTRMAVKHVTVSRPDIRKVLGHSVLDYQPTRDSSPPKLIPIEVVFRFECPAGSSLLSRLEKDPEYLMSLPLPRQYSSTTWALPVIELFTKLEPSDRPLSITEALAIAGLTPMQLQEMVIRTVWVAGILKHIFSEADIEIADGKLEWALSENGSCILVDAIGPDELRLIKDGVHLSKEFLRVFYRKSHWFEAVDKAKKLASSRGILDWKRLVSESPPELPKELKELGEQVYKSLTNRICGRHWFNDGWELEKTVRELKELKKLTDN